MTIRLIEADMRDALRDLAEAGERFHACVCDPPYHLTSGKKGGTGAASLNLNSPAGRARISTGFMGKAWDGGAIAFEPATWRAVYDVLLPGAHLLAFGGTRTYHRMACAIEDAGFEIRDQIGWMFGSGFSKVGLLKNRTELEWCDCDSQASECDVRSVRHANVSTAFNAGDERGQVLQPRVSEQGSFEHGAAWTQSETGRGEQSGVGGRPLYRAGQGIQNGSSEGSSEGASERLCARAHSGSGSHAGSSSDRDGGSSPPQSRQGGQSAGEPTNLREPLGALDDGALRGRGACSRCGKLSRQFEGFSVALKPAMELICVARKPLIGSVAANVLAHGTGALNIDASRIESGGEHMRPGTITKQTTVSGDTREGPALGMYGAGSSFTPTNSPLGRWPANVIHDGSPEVEEAFAAFGESKSSNHTRNNGEFKSVAKGRDLPHATLGISDSGSASRFFYSAKADKDDRAGSGHPTVKPVDLLEYLVRLVTSKGGHVLDPFAGSGTTGEACMKQGFDCTLVESDPTYANDIRHRIKRWSGLDTPLFTVPAEAAE